MTGDSLNLDTLTSDQLVYLARKAEGSERYEGRNYFVSFEVISDMCRFMRQLVLKNSSTTDLNVEERNLLSVAYKNVIGARRATWRTLNDALLQESSKEHSDNEKLLTVYKGQVERELKAICNEALTILTKNLLVVTKGKRDESEVFTSGIFCCNCRFFI